MNLRAIPFIAAAAAFAIAMPAHAVPGGPLRTLPSGLWRCEMPGDATTPPVPQPELNFRTIPDSSYRPASGEGGTYLVLGDVMTMTTGAFRGIRFRVESEGTIRRIAGDDAAPSLRCVRAGVPGGTVARSLPAAASPRATSPS